MTTTEPQPRKPDVATQQIARKLTKQLLYGKGRINLLIGSVKILKDDEDAVYEEVLSAIERAKERLQHSLDFYKRRCDALQKIQSKMRDPERKMVCDILANGETYAQPQRSSVTDEEVDEFMREYREGKHPLSPEFGEALRKMEPKLFAEIRDIINRGKPQPQRSEQQYDSRGCEIFDVPGCKNAIAQAQRDEQQET